MPKIFNKRIMVMEKSKFFKGLKEVVCDGLLVLFVLFILVFPFALVYGCMWLQVIFGL